jgi:hypothetical protein
VAADPRPRAAARRRRRVAAAILVAGWSAAAIVYARAGADAPEVDPESAAEAYDLTHSRSYLRQVERLGGRATVLATEMNEALAAALHGRALACTIAAGTAALAAAYVLLSRAAERADAAPPRPPGRPGGGSQL